jgi:hypothetical protein
MKKRRSTWDMLLDLDILYWSITASLDTDSVSKE